MAHIAMQQNDESGSPVTWGRHVSDEEYAAAPSAGADDRRRHGAGPTTQGALMEQRILGRTGVPVSKLCLGAMMFGAWGNTDHDDSIRIIHAALDAGINFIDTADVYSAGESEEIVGKALAGGKRDEVVLATKVGFPMGDDPNQRGASRRRIISGVEDSLRRLNTDWIDLYQIHRPDPNTDIDETLGALTDLVHQGKIRYFGHSTFPAVGDRRGAVDRRAARPRALPLRAAALLDPHPRHRARRAADLPALRHRRDPLQPAGRRLALGPLPQGAPTRRAIDLGRAPSRALRHVRPGEPAQARRRRAARAARRGDRHHADRAGDRVRPPPPAVTAAIIGPRTMEHLESQLAAADVVLSARCSTASTRSSRPA